MAENVNWTLYFPSNERCIAEFEILNAKLQVQLKADLTKDIYTQNKLEDKELAVVEYLSKVKKLQEEVLSPESDTYATPELTPTDVKHTFGQTRCVSDGGLSSLIESNKTLHSTYYSLVTVDEVYSSDSADILEKELAEQDQLFKSFKSIISKDSKGTKSEVKSLYLSPKNRSASFQNTAKQSSSKKKNGLELKLPLRLSFKDKYSLTQFDNNVNGNVPKKPPLNSEQFAPGDTVNVSYLWNAGSAKRFSLTERQCESNTMSKVKAETEESMEGESVGDAVSSGYLTGSSPKEHTVSEIATSEDIPHDNDRSARSSSVSSDAGTWEPPVVARQIVLSDHDCSVSITNGDNLNIDAFTVCYPANSSHHKNISNERNSLDNSRLCKEFPTNCEYSQIGSSESGNGSQTHSSPSTNEEILVDNKLCNGKSNFFIDAASLLDESEISSIPPNSLSYNGHEFGEFNSLQSWSDNTLSDKPLEITIHLDQVVSHDNSCKQKDISPKGDSGDLEMRRSSFIRRNTFELEPDDERLAVLRSEYERHKQRVTNQHQNSFNSPSQGVFHNDTPVNNFQTGEKNPPNSLPVAFKQPESIPKGDEDVHSPDSLNNDNPLENPFETRLKNDNPSCSLPYDVNTSCKSGKQPTDNHPSKNSESLQSSVNKLDSAPILSGGVSLKDISSPEKPFSSPLMNRRKTELAPIVSGGAVMEPEVEPKPRTASSMSSSWVVDMSDTVKSPQEIRKNKKRDPLSSVNSSDSTKSEESAKPSKVNNSSLGFFIPLDDPFDEKSSADSGYKSSNFQSVKDCDSEKNMSRVETSSNSKNISNCGSSCGFYVDFNNAKASNENTIEKDAAPPDKKLFSMFIDISESGDSGTKSKTSSPLAFKKRTHTRNHSEVFPQKSDEKSRQLSSQVSSESSLEITESPEVSLNQKKESGPPMHLRQIFGPPNSNNISNSNKNKKQGFYMFVDADPSPTAQRRTLPSSSQSSSQRHSWNSDCDPQTLPPVVNTDNGRKKVHRRSHSVSVNKSLEVMFNMDNKDQSSTITPAFKVSTSNSIGYESGPSSIDDTASRHHNSMMASWHGSIKPSLELQKVPETIEKKENLENKAHPRILVKSRSESKSEHLSEMSKSGDKSELTYSSSRDDNLCDLSKTSNESSSAGINNSTFVVSDVSNIANATSNNTDLTTPTCDLASQLSKDDSDKTETDFDENAGPKSADIPRTPDHSISQVEIPTVEHRFSFVKLSDMDKEPKKKMVEGKNMINRMSRSIPEASWIESKMMTRSATSRSLSRLFPHLRNKTPDSADHDTDYSEMSSMQSSMDPSALEGSTEDTDVSSCGGPVSRLGEDLLRMFLDEISPDVTVEVGGRRIKAHKCILSSRCQYFASILSGGWVKSVGHVISECNDVCCTEGSTEDTDVSSCGGPVSRLGEDLLRMFLDEISPDVTVEVGGRRIKAHKCILSSRCQYFASILSGGWVKSVGHVISECNDVCCTEGSTEDTDVSSCGGPVSRLGEDLLRMFLDEISPDVTVEVGGRRIKAHKCILSSGCQCFASILSGGWVKSFGHVISECNDVCCTEGSTEDTDVSSCGGPVSRLGEDLLRMFLDEISPDVTVEVGGRRIKAHKCILSSGCQCFASILSGGWVKSFGHVISECNDVCCTEGSTEDTDVSSCGGPVSRLGEDLLRMFLDEISPDVTVEVGGRRIKAHKCILSSRCQYFAAILSGGWVESAGNVISLQGFSYSAVHFALCHIYSGASNIPDSINIVELATLADMLCLEGLKEVIMYTLKVKYCHFFHKPCPMCTVGVLECLPLAAAYGLDEIYRKSLRWITKYFVRVWPTKGFATLPRELLDKCYKQHIVHMTVDNVLETVLCCSKLQGLIPNVRWAEPVFNLANKLHDTAVKFIALHFSEILSSDMFMSLGKEQMWSMSQLEETLLSAAEKLPPDQACKCHSHLYKLNTAVQAPSPSLPLPLTVNDGFVEFLRLLSSTVEGCLLKQAARASRTPAWTLMEPHLRHKIQDAACLVIVPGDDRRRARHLLKRSEGSAPNKRSVDSAASKASVSEAATAKKATPVRTALPKTPQTANKAENSGPRPKTWPYKISEVKSRYLEPKQTPKQSPALAAVKPNLTPTARRSMNKQIISSSDSSRTSSPATRRSVPPRAASAGNKREDLTMSTDSLADPPLKKKPELARIDFVERNMRAISIKTNTVKTEVTAQRKASSISRIEDKPKYSPIPLSKRSSSQSSPAAAAIKSTVNSTPSPSDRHNTLSPKEKSHVTAETKSSMLKRTSTYRVQPKSASPNKGLAVRTKEPVSTLPNVKGNINKIQSKVNGSKKSPNNNNLSNYNKTEPRPQPMVGSRSGTFLKDEPTVLKKPQIVNVSE